MTLTSVKEPVRQGTIGMFLAAGEIVLTNTGRPTSPFPKISLGTNRAATNTAKRVEAWLMNNALQEARSRSDDYNARWIEAALPNPSPSDMDSAELYLFGDFIPPVRKSLLKPLWTASTKALPETIHAGGRG